MPVELLERAQPRDAGTAEFEEVIAGLFEDEPVTSPQAAIPPDRCITTCFSGVTILCDGSTGQGYTCGWLSLFD